MNSGQAIGKDAMECLSLQLLTRSFLKLHDQEKTITWGKNYNASLKLLVVTDRHKWVQLQFPVLAACTLCTRNTTE